jgi:serine/threonine-protein kinase HipA
VNPFEALAVIFGIEPRRDLLGVVGRTQIGRIPYSDPDAALIEEVPFQSVDEIP